MFSGRPNPVIELEGSEAREAAERLVPVRPLARSEAVLPPWPTLGYRGLVIEQVAAPDKRLPRVFRLVHGDLLGPRLAHRAEDEQFETFALGMSGLVRRLGYGPEFSRRLEREVERFRKLRADLAKRRHRAPVWPKRHRCACAPLYEPHWWNVSQRQPFNNCYNYATNYRTDTFAQPGLAAGAMYAALTCAAVRPAAIADALIDSPGANNRCPDEGHLVALVIAPGWDFHWYRKGRNGYWSHKPGGTPVTNVDNSGAAIPDPRLANRGPYVNFCTFMTVMHGHIKIR